MRESNEQMSHMQNSRAKFKQRVAGGAVLLIVLAIFLPFIFNHSHVETTTDQTQSQQPLVDNTADNTNAAAEPVDPVATQAEPTTEAGAATAAPSDSADVSSAAVAQVAEPDSSQSGVTSSQNEGVDRTEAAQPEESAMAAPAPVAEQTAPPPTVAVLPPKAVAESVLPAPSKTAAKSASHGDWLVQVGSFSQAEYAEQLASKLRAHGLHAYTKRGSNQLVRVYVGPIASEEQAQKIQKRMQTEFQLSTLVRNKRA